MATLAPQSTHISRDDRFFLITAILMALTIVAGFSLQHAMGRSSFVASPPLVHAHAIVFMGWVGIYVTQTALAANRSLTMHRRLGWFAAGWVVLMVVLGFTITVAMVRADRTPFFFTPAYFLLMNPMSVLVFAGLTAAAIVNRRRTAWHRRLHFCGMVAILGPGVGRLVPAPFLIPYAGLAIFGVCMLFPLAGVITDLRRSGRVHRAWLWGIGVLVAMQVSIETLSHTALAQGIFDTAVAGTPLAGSRADVYPPNPLRP